MRCAGESKTTIEVPRNFLVPTKKCQFFVVTVMPAYSTSNGTDRISIVCLRLEKSKFEAIDVCSLPRLPLLLFLTLHVKIYLLAKVLKMPKPFQKLWGASSKQGKSRIIKEKSNKAFTKAIFRQPIAALTILRRAISKPSNKINKVIFFFLILINYFQHGWSWHWSSRKFWPWYFIVKVCRRHLFFENRGCSRLPLHSSIL